jgi:hypothetical protein
MPVDRLQTKSAQIPRCERAWLGHRSPTPLLLRLARLADYWEPRRPQHARRSLVGRGVAHTAGMRGRLDDDNYNC